MAVDGDARLNIPGIFVAAADDDLGKLRFALVPDVDANLGVELPDAGRRREVDETEFHSVGPGFVFIRPVDLVPVGPELERWRIPDDRFVRPRLPDAALHTSLRRMVFAFDNAMLAGRDLDDPRRLLFHLRVRMPKRPLPARPTLERMMRDRRAAPASTVPEVTVPYASVGLRRSTDYCPGTLSAVDQLSCT